jgi:hypothetical protein
MRALSAGTPLVVSDVGWFSELPGDVALKVPVGPGERDALAAAFAADLRDRGIAGRELAEHQHRVERVARLYAEACEEVVGLRSVEDGVLRQVAEAGAEVGLDAATVRTVASAAHEVTRGE